MSDTSSNQRQTGFAGLASSYSKLQPGRIYQRDFLHDFPFSYHDFIRTSHKKMSSDKKFDMNASFPESYERGRRPSQKKANPQQKAEKKMSVKRVSGQGEPIPPGAEKAGNNASSKDHDPVRASKPFPLDSSCKTRNDSELTRGQIPGLIQGNISDQDNTNIPLVCILCPESPPFPNFSNLLTHISSKRHVSLFSDLSVKAHTDGDPEARKQVAKYSQWLNTIQQRIAIEESRDRDRITVHHVYKETTKDTSTVDQNRAIKKNAPTDQDGTTAKTAIDVDTWKSFKGNLRESDKALAEVAKAEKAARDLDHPKVTPKVEDEFIETSKKTGKRTGRRDTIVLD